jgi:hypothetical protein
MPMMMINPIKARTTRHPQFMLFMNSPSPRPWTVEGLAVLSLAIGAPH